MKSTLIFILLVAGLFTTGCSKSDHLCDEGELGQPACITQKINGYAQQACSHNATVKEYTFQNRPVYVFYPGDCGADLATDVWDGSCNHLGYLDGLAGNTRINGVEFKPNATFVRTLWSN